MKIHVFKHSHLRVYARPSIVGVPLACFISLVLNGCTASPGSLVGSSTPPAATVAGTAITGRVHGGQMPISGASVYLFAANTTGYGQQSISLLTDNVLSQNPPGGESGGNYYATTDSNGDFAITSDYTCPSSTSQVYLYAVGGSAGSGSNSAIGLLAGLGSCGTLLSEGATYPFIYVNEVSTIATAYAIAGYASSPTQVSSSGTSLALTGITNAFAAIPNLENMSTGLARSATPAGNGTVPQEEINTLANILAGCVNSTGSGSTGCSMLFGAAKNGSGTEPTETATAAINIAHNPGANISTLWNISTASAPFQSPLSMQPNDFSIAIGYTGGGLGPGTGEVAIDASGNVWAGQTNQSGSGVIIELSPTGSILSGTSGFTGGGEVQDPYDVEIDSSGNVWESDDFTIVELCGSSAGKCGSIGAAISTGSGYAVGAENSPYNIAFDAQGHLWSTDFIDDVLIELSSTGSLLSGNGISGGGLNGPTGVAIDTSGNLWISNDGGTTMSEFNDSGVANMNSPFSGGLEKPAGDCVDPSGNVWIASFDNSSLVKFDSSGGVLFTATASDGLNYPAGPVADSAGNIFVTNLEANSISEFSPNDTLITSTGGYQAAGLDEPDGAVVDGSGNLWVANTTTGAGNNIIEYVGLASPVVTPLVDNLLTSEGYGLHTANKP